MADPFGLAVAAGLVSYMLTEFLELVIKRTQAMELCRSEGAKLATQLESIKPDVERLDNALRKLHSSGLQGDPTGAVKWLKALRHELCEACNVVESCMKKTAQNILHGPSSARKLTELNRNIQRLASQLTFMCTGITILECSFLGLQVSQETLRTAHDVLRENTGMMEILATIYKPRPELPVGNPVVFMSGEWHQDMAEVESRVMANSESAGLHAVWHENGAQEASYPPVPQAIQLFQQHQPHCQDHSGYNQSSYFNPHPWHS